MEESSPIKHKPTSKVIETLHTQIDSLKNELETVKLSHDDYKKKYSIVSKKNESFVDQLANTKHENDMINALLKRKERRIVDLENQFNEIDSVNEQLKLNNKNMKIRCENLQESSNTSTAEFERLKIAYDALIASQNEYKRHYQKELNSLTLQFEEFKNQSSKNYQELSDKLSHNDKDVDTLLDGLTNKRKTMDNLYVNKNKAVLDLLAKLAKASKIHGQETKIDLENNIDVINKLIEKYPDLQLRVAEHQQNDIDLEELLGETNDTLSNSSFDEEATLINSPDLQKESVESNKQQPTLSRNNTMSSKKRKNKRNSIRFDSKGAPDFSALQSPTQLNIPKRSSIQLNSNHSNSTPVSHSHNRNHSYTNDSKARTPTPPEESYRASYNNLNYNSSNNHNNNHSRNNSINSGYNNQRYRNPSTNLNSSNNSNNRSKRRSTYGNNFNNGGYGGGNHSRQNSKHFDPLVLNS